MRFINSRLSVRLSLTVVLPTTVLLVMSLAVMLHYSRKAVKDEAVHKASQSLDGSIQYIDNILLSVEQATGNIYWNLVMHLDQPERMFTYSRETVKSNPYIDGCAIAFEPYYYPAHGKYFMAYVHRTDRSQLAETDSPVIQQEIFGNRPYNEQIWYTKPMELGKPYWTDPLKDEDTEDNNALITFCLPIYDQGKKVGVMAVDVSLSLLSKVILATKPSPNSYSTMLGRNGSYIVHPDSNKLLHHTVYTQLKPDDHPTEKEAAEAMVAGKSGYLPLRQDGKDYFVFYKPFRRVAIEGRANDDMGWSVGIVYPEDDIFGEYNLLLYYIIAIAVIALLLLMVTCWAFAHYQLTPLQILTLSAQRIAGGHYDDLIPKSRQQDEIGRLQDAFQQMQQSLSHYVGELKQLTTSLQERNEDLRTAYHHAQEADLVKTKFLHNMTNQMLIPADTIVKRVEALCDMEHEKRKQEAQQIEDDIQLQGKAITVVLGSLLDKSNAGIRKEDIYE